MALFSWSRTGFGRTWSIDIGTGTSADLLVKQWPVLDFVKRPTKKDTGVYPRKLTIPIVDYDSTNGYLRDAVFDSELECTLSLDSSAIFSGVIYQSDIIKAVGEDQYDTEFIVSDGLQRLRSSDEFSGTYTYEEFLKELLWETGFELDIHFYTDWEEDNASAGLVDTHRLTYEGDNYMEVLQNFCNDFGYQVFQENNVWVVRSLAYFEGTSVTRYVISSASPTSSSVTLTESISGLYKSSEEDIIRGTGKVRVIFEWDILEGEFINSEFEEFEDGAFVGWETVGATERELQSEATASIDSNSDYLKQRYPALLRASDLLDISINLFVEKAQLGGGETRTADYAQVKLIDGISGDEFWIKEDGTAQSTEYTWSHDVDFTGVDTGLENVTEESNIRISDFAGVSNDFAGFLEITLLFNQKFIGGTDAFSSFNFYDSTTVLRPINRRYSKLTTVANGSGFSTKEIDLTISSNSQQFADTLIEYYDGSVWRPAIEWDTLFFGQKRAKDELIVRNQDMSMIRANLDYGTYKGLEKIYADSSKDYIPLTSKITVGLDDVEVVFVQHERSAGTITVNDDFSNDN